MPAPKNKKKSSGFDRTKTPQPAPPGQTPSRVPMASAIADRAYQLFVERGGEHGRDWEDWLRAEHELQSNAG